MNLLILGGTKFVERHATGIYITNGLDARTSWGECFEKAQRVTGANTTLTWVSEDFLREQKVGEGDLPIFAFAEDAGAHTFNNHKAIAAGLRFRPIAETIRDTLLWDAAEGGPKLGLSLEREQELLRAWHASQ